jgi:hypothetical protein
MLHHTTLLASLAGAALIGTGTAHAATPLPARPATPAISTVRPPLPHPNNHMPGWDWWRTYPWSPYNIYNPNNPYSPYYHNWVNPPYPYPYPYPTPYLYPTPYPTPYVNPVVNPYIAPEAGNLGLGNQARLATPVQVQQLGLVPLTDAGIRLRLPDANATVAFNGRQVPGLGTTRYYLIPNVPDIGEFHTNVTVTVRHDGRTWSAPAGPRRPTSPIPIRPTSAPCPGKSASEPHRAVGSNPAACFLRGGVPPLAPGSPGRHNHRARIRSAGGDHP